MKLTLLILFIHITEIMLSQGFVLKGGHLKVSGNTNIVLAGSNCNWVNNGATFSGGTGRVIFSGSNAQLIEGTAVTTFNNVTVKNANNVSLAINSEIDGELLFNTGNFDLKEYVLDLGTTGTLSEESNSSKVVVTPVAFGGNNGSITASRNLISGMNSNIAGLGIDINSNTFTGNKTITRYHQELQGAYNGTTYSSALKSFLLPGIGELSATNAISINFFDNELNGSAAANMQLYQEITQSAANTWYTPLDGSVHLGANSGTIMLGAVPPYHNDIYNNIGQFAFNDLIVVGSKAGDHPLPISLSNLSVSCLENTIIVTWTTESEINNNFIVIEKSYNGISWAEAGRIKGAGNSNSKKDYSFTDKYEGVKCYYRLRQFDFNGNHNVSETVYTSCGHYSMTESKIKIQSGSDGFLINLNARENEKYFVVVTDKLGKIILSEQVFSIGSNLDFKISKNSLASGLYDLIIIGNTERFREKIAVLQN